MKFPECCKACGIAVLHVHQLNLHNLLLSPSFMLVCNTVYRLKKLYLPW